MRIVEINAMENGAHKNQMFHGVLPDGWAILPDNMVCENFPFGEITVDDTHTPPVVKSWTPGEIPEPEPILEPEEETSVWDELDAAWDAGYTEGYQEGVNTAYDQ